MGAPYSKIISTLDQGGDRRTVTATYRYGATAITIVRVLVWRMMRATRSNGVPVDGFFDRVGLLTRILISFLLLPRDRQRQQSGYREAPWRR